MRRVEEAASRARSALFEPVIRLGVTGLSRSGKTVFITSLVANMLDRGRMPQLIAASNGAITAAFLQPQPDDTIPRFEYERHLAALSGPDPHWPQSTRAISQLRLSIRVQPVGFFGGMSGPKTVHVDIVDYPGEWLLDLPLMTQSFADWSREALAAGEARGEISKSWRAEYAKIDPAAPFDEAVAQGLAGRSPRICRARARRGSRLVLRVGSCCRASWKARLR